MNTVSHLGLFARTVSHLKRRQLLDRVARELRPLRQLPESDPDVSLLERDPSVSATAASRQGVFDGETFQLLGRRLTFQGRDRWFPASADRLWTYHLHSFRYLADLGAASGLRLIRDWIKCNTSSGGPGWEPHPISLRVREWTEWLLARRDLEPAVRQTILRSLSQQVSALAQQIEHHLMGNHLLENGITLCWAGLSLRSRRREEWIRSGMRILEEEVSRQVLPDGSHDERSPMYQALLAEGLLRLAEVAGRSADAEAPAVRTIALDGGSRLLRSLSSLVHPDGDFALLNDCALGIAPMYLDLTRRFPFAACTGSRRIGVWTLPDAGYVGRTWDPSSYLVFDLGAIGPDHQPGHGHADTLSFEISHRGKRLVTDTGVYEYTVGDRRRHDRSTAAHNTIEVDARDQSELWAAFRCGARAVPACGALDAGSTGDGFVGAYQTPNWPHGRVHHTRRVRPSRSRIQFRDLVTFRGSHTAILRLHLAPGAVVRPAHGHIDILQDGRHSATIAGGGFGWTEGRSPYHPQFGVELERACLFSSFDFRDRLMLDWFIELH